MSCLTHHYQENVMYSSKTGFFTFTKLLQLLLASGTVIVLIKGALVLTVVQSGDQERKFKTKEFRDMPLRVRKVKNLQSPLAQRFGNRNRECFEQADLFYKCGLGISGRSCS